MLITFVLLFYIEIVKTSTISETSSIVFTRGENGYYCIKIPSILVTVTGTLLAFGEARMFSCGDSTKTDLVYKRSIDNGRTWSNLSILYSTSNDKYDRVGNVAPIQLEYKQRILIPFCKNNLILMQTYSDDDGQTFMKPEIIQNVTKSNWKWIGFGPPSGILLKSNRILIPSYYSTHLNDNGLLSTGIVMLNDFNGQIDKWFIGGEFSANDELFPNIFPNECQAVELSKPNSIFINARSFGTKRIGVYSLDGGITFSKVNLINNLVQPLTGCQGSMIRHPRTNELFYSGLADINIIRRNLTLYKSNDNGLNWTFLKLIYEQSSAYSSLTILPDQSIGLLYEWANKTDLIFQPDYITFTVVWRP